MNYSELTQQIQDYLQTTETSFVTNIPTFVKLAEERINREVIIPDLRRSAIGNFTALNRYLQKPSDYLATFDKDQLTVLLNTVEMVTPEE